VIIEYKSISGSLGKWYFYGCSKLKQIEIGAAPSGKGSILNSPESFAECTSLEKVTIYTSKIGMGASEGLFRNCVNLKSVEILAPTYEYDAFGNIIGYGTTTPNGFLSANDGAFEGCINLKSIPIRQDYQFTIYGSPFKGSGIEELKISQLSGFAAPGFMAIPHKTFAGSNVKTLYIGQLSEWLSVVENVFADVDHEMNVYFYHHTYEEVLALCQGNTAWFDTASENVHFYFKDTMPADVVVPGGTDIPMPAPQPGGGGR
jgi:hypothetical protein